MVGLTKIYGKAQNMLSGDQDGFPDHILTINDSVVYFHECLIAEKTPGDLAPLSEISVSKGWRDL